MLLGYLISNLVSIFLIVVYDVSSGLTMLCRDGIHAIKVITNKIAGTALLFKRSLIFILFFLFLCLDEWIQYSS